MSIKLDMEVARLRSGIQHAERGLVEAQRRQSSIQRFHTFLKLQKHARRWVDATIIWRPLAILIGVTAIGGSAYALSRSPAIGITAGILATVAMVTLMLYPSDACASERLRAMVVEFTELNLKLVQDTTHITLMKNKLRKLNRELRIASDDYRRRMLLAENWKAMRSVDFEKFLERVFSELGYEVETTKTTGDQGVDLIVCYRGKRIAIQVKGYVNSVSNGAVQEAHAGMTYYKCHASAVITNSRYTKSAIDLAASVDCILVDENLLPRLVMGEIDLWSRCFERTV